MKKLIPTILSAVLIFSVIPNIYVDAADINKQVGKAYADIIQQYLAAEKLENRTFGYEEYENVNSQFIEQNAQTEYSIKDYNNDGIPELFIASSPTLYDIYTYHKGKAVRISNIMDVELGYRLRCILCKNGIIEFTSGGGYWDMVVFYKLPQNGNKLKKVRSIGYDINGNTNKATYYDSTNNKSKKISEMRYNKLYKKYDKRIKITFYKADRKAVSNIRKGIFTYQNQKKWTGKME